MSAGIELKGFVRFRKFLDKLSYPDTKDLLDTIGSIIESQTVERIKSEGPDYKGNKWPEWSDAYAKTRGPQHSKLRNDGDLLESITYVVSPDGSQLEIGSNLKYAATHQYGDKRLAFGKHMATYPARPYLGISNENEDSIEEEIRTWFKEMLGVSV